MKIYIGADHNGFHLKNKLKSYLMRAGYDVEDEGDDKLDPEDDFPIFASKVATAVLTSADKDPRGILICGSGQGMCMAANRFKGIRASTVWDRTEAKLTRNDNDSNVLCIPARVVDSKEMDLIVETWLNTPFAKAARYIRRNKQLDEIN
jgi:ribose 5-phosphate isomerase B